jgi:hypothetical protein
MKRYFAYRDLDLSSESRQIRLLKLLPAPSINDDIRCTIYHSSLDDSPTYEALSYVWGSEDKKPFISVGYQPQHSAEVSQQHEAEDGDGSLDSGLQLDVTRNLHDALRHIRLPESERIMWIDAICINQELDLEKNHQVNLMGQIYKASKQVVLWLGEEKDSAIALNFLRKMPLGSNGYADSSSLNLKDEDSTDWVALSACEDLFLKRPYWHRSWILQEVVHGRDVTVYIGTQKLPIEDLLRHFTIFFVLRMAIISLLTSPYNKAEHEKGVMSIETWFRSAGAAKSMPNSLINLRARFKQSSEEPRLAALLHTFRGQLAKKPKDKIYSLLGMAKKEYEIEINYNPDETKGGLTTRSLYTLTTRKMLTRALSGLLWIESPARKISCGLDGVELPSWVPDFTHQQQLTPLCLYSRIILFSADKGFPGGIKAAPSSVSDRCGIFTIRGVNVGCITGTHVIHVTKKWSNDPTEKDFDLLKLFRYKLTPQLSNLGGTTSSGPWPVSESEQPAPTFENTSWGPIMAENRDIIVVAAGCKIPLVLRRHDDKYLFVGGCWLIESKVDVRKLERECGELDGFSKIMYGSVVEQIGKTCEVEDFELC